MQFVYHKDAGEASFNADLRAYEHVFKVRRNGIGTILLWRNMNDDMIYEYEIVSIGKKEAVLELRSSKSLVIHASHSLHIGWSVIDPKIIEKTLPMLNELGVEKVTFFYADFSQKQFKLDDERMQRILINSSQQCGRSTLMYLEMTKDLNSFLTTYPDATIIDFSPTVLNEEHKEGISTVVIGPEGGFSESERKLIKKEKILGLKSSSILRSETAVVAVASKILV